MPLGGRRSHPDDYAPRVEIITSRRDGQDDYDGAILRPDVERRVGLSLTKNTRFYVDGRAVDLNGDNQRAGISDTVLIVGVVVLVGVVVAVASNFNDLSFDQD